MNPDAAESAITSDGPTGGVTSPRDGAQIPFCDAGETPHGDTVRPDAHSRSRYQRTPTKPER